MKRFEQSSENMIYTHSPDRSRAREDWFGVVGDLDDFIFYDGSSDEDTTRPSRR